MRRVIALTRPVTKASTISVAHAKMIRLSAIAMRGVYEYQGIEETSMRNWCGLVDFAAAERVEPATLAEVQQVVSRSPKMRAIGTAHCFNDLADTTGTHLSVARLPIDLDIDVARGEARFAAGIRYGELARLLDEQGWAVHNLASLGHISVAGAVATGTHGSGDRNQNLSAAVRWMQLVTADGDVLEIDDRDPRLAAMVVSLGSLGIVTRIGLAIEPAYRVRQYVFDRISHAALLENFDGIFSSAYSVSFFTTWSKDLTGQVWMKRREGQDDAWTLDEWMGGHLCQEKQHPLPGHDPVHCTEQLGVPGPSHDRLPHFKLDFTPSSGDELQTEYLVPRDQAVAALAAFGAVAPRIAPLLQVSEIRTMASDDRWLSGAYGRDTVGIHFTWVKDPGVLALLPEIDSFFAAFGGRAHWGKLHATPAGAYRMRYPKLPDFMAIRARFDERGKFGNAHLSWMESSAS